ncbi:MAG: 23S rRNA-/tRNA-specific pseudouridylate synthase [Myxococcota bacterium]|jgi:23S rRNA-/tRNA-specific pseudouridylate synthase
MIVQATARWLALEKPSGLPVFPPHTDPDGDCLLARLLRAAPEQGDHDWPPGFAGGIAHRLDIPTSGLVLAAATPADLVWLRSLFTEKKLRKTYLLLTARDVPWSSTTVDAAIAHDRRRKKRMVVQRGQNTPHRGRWLPAETRFTRRGAAGRLRCWQAEMATGVMHQIRVHAGFAGIALVGDRLYGGGATPAGFAADFALHHVGLVGPGLSPPRLAMPPWWPTLSGA